MDNDIGNIFNDFLQKSNNMAAYVPAEDIVDGGVGGTSHPLASFFVHIARMLESAWSLCTGMLSSADRWQVALACTFVLILTANVWGIATSVILSKFFRQPIKKAAGMTYRSINISPLRMSISIKGVVIRPSDSTVARVYFLTLFPSADVVSPDPSTLSSWGKVKNHFLPKKHRPPPPGSVLKVESISISFSVGITRFRPIARILKKLKQSETQTLNLDGGDLEENIDDHRPGGEKDETVPQPDSWIGANGRLGNIRGKLDPRKWHHYIMLCGPVPRISAEIHGLRIEIDKVYLAPPAPSFPVADLGGQAVSFQGVENSQRASVPSPLPLPAVVLPPDYDISSDTNLPTFDQFTVLEMLEQDEIVEADSCTFFLERWLERARTEEKARLAKESKDGEQLNDSSVAGNEVGEKVTDNANVQKNEDIERDANVLEEVQENDRTNALLKSMFNGLLSSAKISATDISLVITGADSETIRNARKNLEPYLATISLAEIPLSQRAKTEMTVDRLTLSFRNDGSCNAVFAVVGLGVKTWLPPSLTPSVSAAVVSEEKQKYIVVPSQNYIVEIKGVLSYLIWSTNYDHSWEKRKLGVEISASKVAICMAPRPLHTVLMHLDDFSDPNSPYAEWVSWLSKCRLAASPLSDEESGLYRMLYLKDRGEKEQQMQKQKKGGKHQTSDGSHQDSLRQLELDSEPTPRSETQSQTAVLGKAAVQLEALEKRMSRSEIMQQRCAAMGEKWGVPKANREMIQYLDSTASRVKPSAVVEEEGENKSTTKQRTSPFERVYRHSSLALVSLVRQKFDLLSCRVSVSLCIESIHLDVPDEPQFSATADPFLMEGPRPKSAGVGSSINDSINDVRTTAPEVGEPKCPPRAPVHSTLTLYGLKVFLLQTSAVYAEQTVIDPKKIPSEGGEVRIVQQLFFSLESAKWYPMDVLAVEDARWNLPRFQDESLCGILYKHPDQTGDPDTILKLNIKNGVTPAQLEPAYVAVECECSDLVVIANPMPLVAATEALAAASLLPFRDLLAERQLVAKMHTNSAVSRPSLYQSRRSMSLESRDDISKDDSPAVVSTTAGENKSNGTVLSGIDGNVRANIINVSLLFLTDATNIDKGTLELHLSDLSLTVNSSSEGENAQLSVMPVTLSACRLIGSNDGGGKVKLQGQPFKHVMNLDSFQLKYSAKAPPPTRMPLDGSEVTDVSTVIETPRCVVEVTGYMGTALFHSSQTINVVLMGCFETMKPLIGMSEKRQALIAQQKAQKQQQEEAERVQMLRTRREALQDLWLEVDIDGSNTLDNHEVENVIVRLFDSSATDSDSFGKEVQQASKLTSEELQRELRHFISLIDTNRGNEISFQEVDHILFRTENDRDDARLVENEGWHDPNAAHEPTLASLKYEKDRFSQMGDFKPNLQLRGLIYYDDLREFSAISEVFRITGSKSVRFPPPSTWRRGRGIHLFWELYERETGCSRTSLNGQDIAVVQQKLVRSLLNYEFAKFCWKSLCKPGLESVSGQRIRKLKGYNPTAQLSSRDDAPMDSQKARREKKKAVTSWQLDSNTKAKIRAGVVDRLLRHVQEVSSGIEQERALRLGRIQMKQNFHYELKVLLELDHIRFSSGNSLAFTVPLLASHISRVNISGNGLLQHPLNGGFFVSKPQTTEKGNEMQTTKNQEEATEAQSPNETLLNNNLHFECILSTDYLNTKHNTVETMIEPFVAFGNVSYDSSKKKSDSRDVQDLEVSALTLDIQCPLVFNMNASPSSVETFNLIKGIYVDASPESYEKLALEQELNTVRQIWDAFNVKRLTHLPPVQVQAIMRTYLSSHWKLKEGLVTETDAEAFILRFVTTMDPDNDGLISFSDVDHAFRSLKFSASASFFNSSSKIRLQNCTGSNLKYCSRESLEKYSKNKPSASLSELMSMFDEVGDNRFRPVSISTKMQKRTTELERITDRLVLSVPGFKVVDEVSVSSHQTLLFPLKRQKSRRARRVGVHHRRCASGFDPYLAVVPGTDKLDIITLTARSSITVQAETPIEIRVVSLPKSSIKLLRGRKKRNSKSLIDLTKKRFLLALEQACDGARIVFEKTMDQGSSVPLPVQSVASSSYHVLLVKDASKDDADLWRKPVLLTKEFLYNTDHISHINQAHAASGITVQRDRLNVYRSEKSKRKAKVSRSGIAMIGASERKKTAWDTTIQVMPSMVLSNSLPFSIQFRCWQIYREDDTGGWSRDDFATEEETIRRADAAEDSSESSDDQTAQSSRMLKRGEVVRRHTVQTGKRQNAFTAMGGLSKGGEERLHGIDMNEVFYIQISQDVHFITRPNGNLALSKLVWSPPMQIYLNKLRTGGRISGSLSHPRITGQLGDEADLSIDVTVERNGIPYCNLYCPYWVVNKTGFKMKFKFAGRNETVHDSGTGGLPILAQCNVDDKSKIGVASHEITTVPLEAVSDRVSAVWWDNETNGELVLHQPQLKEKGKSLVDWSDKIGLDAAGTVGEVSCKGVLFGVKIETLTGVFHRSNLITFGPQYIIKNVMNLGVTLFPVMGEMNDVKKMANYLRNRKDMGGSSISFFNHKLVTLRTNQSTVFYRFHDLSQWGQQSKKLRFILMRVDVTRWHFLPKWHIVPVDILGLSHYVERDGIFDSICAVVKVNVQKSDAATVVNIMGSPRPPYRIENRSNTHFVQLVQDDEEGVVVELPPMTFCGYAWDNPWSKKNRLRVVVVEADQSRQYLMKQAEMDENVESDASSESNDENENDDTVADSDREEDSAECATTAEVESKDAQSFLSSFTYPTTDKTELIDTKLTEYNRTISPLIKRKRLWSPRSRSYNLSKVGELKPLPCPSPDEKKNAKNFSSILFVEVRIEAGSRVVSFNDSTWHSEQEKLGHVQSGGNWKNASINIGIEGFSINLIDSFPREILCLMLREFMVYKAAGSIETKAILRHIQMDAMIPSARYPIVLSPIPLGVDRHDWPGGVIGCTPDDATSVSGTTGKTLTVEDQYWLAHSEKPIPVFRAHISYLPQNNMTWIPDMKVAISPLKMTVEIDYVLRVVDLLLNSVLTSDDIKAEADETMALVNSKLQYSSRQQDDMFLTYVENMVIAPVFFEVELILKPERDDNNKDEDVEGQSVLALNSLGRSTKSGVSAGLLSWVTNVASTFAHVSPKFTFKEVSRIDQYCDADELAVEIAQYYSTQIILQSYKVFFSMQLLGDPTQLLSGYKTGFVDIFAVTKKEIEAGGQDGMGMGAVSWLENVVGGTFFALGKVSGGVADVLDSATTNDLTDNTYKPKSTSSSDSPEHAIDGIVQGTVFLGKALTHGVAGVFGNPYRGMKQGSAGAMTKGVVSGVAGLAVAPFVGALGFTAKVTEGIGATTKVFEVRVIEARCRPSRIVGWGSSIGAVPLSYLKAIAIRVHVVRYQKKRRGFPPRRSEDSAIADAGESKDAYPKNAAEFKKAKAAEEKRKNPTSKVITIICTKEKSHHLTASAKPKLLSDDSRPEASSKISRYSVTFEETIVLRCPDFQLSDVITLQLWNNKTIRRAMTKAKPLAQCSLTMGDIYSSMVRLHNEKIRQKELHLSHQTSMRWNAKPKDEQCVCPVTPAMLSHMDSMRQKDEDEPSLNTDDTKIPIPPVQEYVLMRPGDRRRAPKHVSAAAAIQDEMAALKREEQEAIESLIDSDSSYSSDSDSSFFLDGESRHRPEEDLATMARSMENLYGHVSLSFFPLPW